MTDTSLLRNDGVHGDNCHHLEFGLDYDHAHRDGDDFDGGDRDDNHDDHVHGDGGRNACR